MKNNNDIEYVYVSPRPLLEITFIKEKLISNCYRQYVYKIISRFELTEKYITDFQRSGFIHGGQTTNISKTEKSDMVKCSVRNITTGEVLNKPAVNPYSNKPYEDHAMLYNEYIVEVFCDSGD